MAESIPFGIATNILTSLGSTVFQQIGSIYGVKRDLQKLENTLSTIRAVLLDAEERQEQSYLVQDWIKRLKDVVYDADDVLDVAETRVCHVWAGKYADQLLSCFDIAFRYKMSRWIRKIQLRLDEVAADMTRFNFRERVIIDLCRDKRQHQETHSFVLESEIIGRDKDKEAIIDSLARCVSQETCSIIGIVGIGGLGKTALAQLVYNDTRVDHLFERKIWVSVTQDFNVELVIRKMVMSMANTELGNLNMDQLQTRLRDGLMNKRYLLVLDDVWNENYEKWICLKNLLVCAGMGSKILVTTRSMKVASVIGAESLHLLRGLTEEESWMLFKKIAFQSGEDRFLESRLNIAKRIVGRCQGVPLAIRTLGSVMQFKTEESEWFDVETSEIWKLSQDSTDILPVLKLSYDHLPVYLRQCFAFCSIFPKGYRIFKDQLIQLWMAQGYIHSTNGNQMLEEIGDQYFGDLLSRSFFQEVEKDECDSIISCKMHDLIHDLAQTVAGTDCCISGTDAGNASKRVRHISFDHSLPYEWRVPRHLMQVKGLRTLLLPVNDRWINESNQASLVSTFKSLRALDIHCLGFEKLPNSIVKLKHLRYLDISSNSLIERLPSCVCDLHNLQTLRLSYCEKLVELPRDIRKLILLRHLVINKCVSLAYMPSGLGELISLRTLSRFIVPRVQTTGTGRANLNELNGLNLLRGEIWLKNLECLTDSDIESTEPNLKEKKYLLFLGLQWTPTKADVRKNSEALLNKLEPHPNLKHVWIEGYSGIKFSQWLSSLRNIVKITIRNCPNCECLPSLDQLPSLRYLHLHKLPELKHGDTVTADVSEPITAFLPSLEELWLYGLPNFMGWRSMKEGVERSTAEGVDEFWQYVFPMAPNLYIQRCSKLSSMPFYPSLQIHQTTNSSMKTAMSNHTIPNLSMPFSIF